MGSSQRVHLHRGEMPVRILSLLALPLIACSSCAPAKRAGSAANRPWPEVVECSRSNVDYVPVPGAPHARTPNQPPGPCRTTNLGIDVLEQTIGDYVARTGRLPARLEELLTLEYEPPRPPPKDWWFVDGWGTRFRYVALDRSFRIQSAGPDRTFDTDDDVIGETILARPG